MYEKIKSMGKTSKNQESPDKIRDFVSLIFFFFMVIDTIKTRYIKFDNQYFL